MLSWIAFVFSLLGQFRQSRARSDQQEYGRTVSAHLRWSPITNLYANASRFLSTFYQFTNVSAIDAYWRWKDLTRPRCCQPGLLKDALLFFFFFFFSSAPLPSLLPWPAPFLFLSSRDIPQCGRTIAAGMRRPTTSPMRERTKTNQIILQSIRGVRCPLDHRRYEIKVFLLFMYIFLQNISSLSRHISILTRARHSIPRLSTVMDPSSSSSSSFSSSVVCVCVSLCASSSSASSPTFS